MTKGGGWLIGLLFYIILCVQGHTQDDYNQNGLDCWDECVFEQADDSKSTSALSMLYDIINRVRHLRIFDGVSLTLNLSCRQRIPSSGFQNGKYFIA